MSARDEAKQLATDAKKDGATYNPFPEYAALSIKQAAAIMQKLKKQYDDADTKAADIFKRYDSLRKVYLPEMMEKSGTESVRLAGIGMVSLASDAYISQKDAEALADWLKKMKHESLIKPTINSSSLKSFIFELVRDGKQIPGDEILSFTPYSYVKITK